MMSCLMIPLTTVAGERNLRALSDCTALAGNSDSPEGARDDCTAQIKGISLFGEGLDEALKKDTSHKRYGRYHGNVETQGQVS